MAGRKPEVEDHELLREVVLSPYPVVTTSEIGEKVDLSRQAVHKRFQSLEEEGMLKSRDVGSKAVVWWITDKGREKATRETA